MHIFNDRCIITHTPYLSTIKWEGGCRLRVVPPGQLHKRPSTAKRFCLSAIFIEPGLSIFCVVKFLSHVFFCVCFPEVQGLSPRLLCLFSNSFQFKFLIYSLLVSIVGSLRDREVACLASDRQGSNFESCVWRAVSSQSSHHPQEVLLAQFSLYVHKGGLKPESFLLFIYSLYILYIFIFLYFLKYYFIVQWVL